MVITQTYVRVELTISTSSKETNKRYFKNLYQNKNIIETLFGNELIWEELPNNKMSRIKYQLNDVNLFNENDWGKMNDFIISNLPKFEEAFKGVIEKLK